MKEKIIYETEDGKIFHDRDEALEYEKKVYFESINIHMLSNIDTDLHEDCTYLYITNKNQLDLFLNTISTSCKVFLYGTYSYYSINKNEDKNKKYNIIYEKIKYPSWISTQFNIESTYYIVIMLNIDIDKELEKIKLQFMTFKSRIENKSENKSFCVHKFHSKDFTYTTDCDIAYKLEDSIAMKYSKTNKCFFCGKPVKIDMV